MKFVGIDRLNPYWYLAFSFSGSIGLLFILYARRSPSNLFGCYWVLYLRYTITDNLRGEFFQWKWPWLCVDMTSRTLICWHPAIALFSTQLRVSRMSKFSFKGSKLFYFFNIVWLDWNLFRLQHAYSAPKTIDSKCNAWEQEEFFCFKYFRTLSSWRL